MAITDVSIAELEQSVKRLRPSQRAFIFAPQRYSAIDGGWGCLSGNTQVLTPSGKKSMVDITPGDIVYAVDGTKTKVIKKWDNGVKPVYRWFGKRGNRNFFIDATKDHKVWGCTEKKPEPKLYPLGELEKKNRSYFVRGCGHDFGNKEYPLALFIGLLLGDGYLGYQIQWTCAEPEIVLEVSNYLKKLGIGLTVRGIQNLPTGCGSNGKNIVKQEIIRLGLYETRSGNKFIPDEVWDWKKEDVSRLLGGMIASDGSVFYSKGRNESKKWKLSYNSNSFALIDGFRRLMEEGFGIYGGSISKDKRGTYSISFSTKENLELLSAIPVPGRKGRLLKEAAKSLNRDSRASRIAILGKKFLGEMETYDITIEHHSHIFLLDSMLPVANSGKTYAGCIKGLILSAAYPGNAGLIGRFNATDLADSTMPVFFEICPPSWIKQYKKSEKKLIFKNSSTIIFRHIHDPNPKRRHITSTNLGWFFVDQAEEAELDHWNTLIGRLRLPRAKKKFGFIAANPNGKDWIYNTFFISFNGFRPGSFFETFVKGSRLGVATKSEENKISNGGFVEDDYFESLREQMPPEWVARYLDCSFEDFAGKIYREYNLGSVHNIKRFPIPEHWPIRIGIDVGGDTPWGITANAFDETGNMITFANFHKPSVLVSEIANWIKANTPWNQPRTTFVIDTENKVAMLELQQMHKITCQPAIKKVHPGILKFGGYVHIQPKAELPMWYEKTQTPQMVQRFVGKGSPKWFVFEDCEATRNEHDNYIWDMNKPGKPVKKNDHTPDANRYVVMSIPAYLSASKLPNNRRMEYLKQHDPGAHREWSELDRRIKARMDFRKGRGGGLEAMMDEVPSGFDPRIHLPSRKGWDWND